MANHQTLGQALKGARHFQVNCYACQHYAIWPVRSALKVFGENATPYIVRKRLRCAVCGSKSVDAGPMVKLPL